MADDQRTNFILKHSEAARREGLEREAKTDRFQRCEILGECLTQVILQGQNPSLFEMLRKTI